MSSRHNRIAKLTGIVVALLAAVLPLAATQHAGADESPGDPQRQLVALDPAVPGGGLDAIERTGAEVVDYMHHLDVAVVDASASEADRIARTPGVSAVAPNRAVQPVLDETVPYVGGTAAHAAGFSGQGTWVAVLDTGVDLSHPTFAGIPSIEACFAPSNSTCPNGGTWQTGPGSAAPDTCSGCWHGTHVAGIAVGRGGGGVSKGVAPKAGLISIQVFGLSDGALVGDTYSVIAGLDYVAGLAGARRVASVNLSLTLDVEPEPGTCDDVDPTMKAAIDRLLTKRVLTVAAAGNEHLDRAPDPPILANKDAIAPPACFSNVVSVASIDLPDGADPAKVSDFSHSSALVDVLAPGRAVTSAIPGGAASASGTSASAPHVAGAVALFTAAHPTAPPSAIRRLLKETGTPHDDPDLERGSFRILDAEALVRSIGEGVGVVTPTEIAQRNSLTDGPPATSVAVPVGATILTGDWDGNGTDTLGYKTGQTYKLTNRADGQAPFITFNYGWSTDVPVTGDWDGNGQDSIGIRRGNKYYLRNSHSGGAANYTFAYGTHSDVPVTGDWDGNGTDTPGIRRGNRYYLRNTNTSGIADYYFVYGTHTDRPITGDWDGNGSDTPGIRRGNQYFLSNNHLGGNASITFVYGAADDIPIAGNWDGI